MEIVPFIAPKYSGLVHEINRKEINKVALIDADRYKHIVTYRVWEKVAKLKMTHSLEIVNEIIDSYLSHDIFDVFEADAYVFCFSAPSSNVYRNSIAQDKMYKGNRIGRDDPHFYSEKYDDMKYVYQYINERYHTLFQNDLEADDLLSMFQCENTFIFSHDKDLRQVAGWHWDINSMNLIYISEEEGFKHLMLQILKGDSTDNFSGLKGFGDKSLEKFLEEINSPGLTSEGLLFSTIKRFVDTLGLNFGIDTFVEMYYLASMKINRGKYLQEKYSTCYFKMDGLLKTLYDVKNGNAKHNGDDQNK